MTTSIKEIEKCSPAENSQPAVENQPCTCRKCGGVMEAKWQSPLIPGRAGYWLLTCWNRCALNGYTFTNNTYPSVDLTPYLEEKHS